MREKERQGLREWRWRKTTLDVLGFSFLMGVILPKVVNRLSMEVWEIMAGYTSWPVSLNGLRDLQSSATTQCRTRKVRLQWGLYGQLAPYSGSTFGNQGIQNDS